MKNRGQIVEDRVRKSGMSILSVAGKIKRAPKTLYSYFTKEDLDFEEIRKIGKAINYDFEIDIPEMRDYYKNPITRVEDPPLGYQKKIEYWKEKYMQLQQDFNDYQYKMSQRLVDLHESNISIQQKGLKDISEAIKSLQA